MKKYKIAFWVSTLAIFVFEGVMPALTGNSEMARAGVMHLGYPGYFAPLLAIFKVVGSVGLIVPLPNRIKEWVYAGFGFDFIFAFVSTVIVDGFSGIAFLPIVCLALLVVSYVSRMKIQGASFA